MIKGSLFRKTFITYLCLLLILIFGFGAIYFESYQRQSGESQRQYYAGDLERIKTELDNQLLELMTLKNNIKYTTWVNKLATPTDTFSSDFDLISKIEYQNQLKRYIALNGTLLEIAVILPDKDTVVSQNGWFTVSEYEKYLNSKSRKDFDDWFGFIKKTSGLNSLMEIKENISNNKSMICVQSIDDLQPSNVALMLMIDKEKYQNKIAGFASAELLQLEFVSENNSVLATYQNTATKPSSRQYSAHTKSNYLNANYSVTYMLDNNDKFIVFMLLLLVVMGLIFATVAYFLSLISYKPLQKLLGNIATINGGDSVSEHEYEFIERSFENINNKNVTMNQKVQLYYHAARNNILVKLLLGQFSGNEQQLSQYDLEYTDGFLYMVLLADTSSESLSDKLVEDVKISSRLMLIIGKVLSDDNYVFEIVETTNNDMAVILSFNKNDVDILKILKTAYNLKSAIIQKTHLNLDIALGGMHGGIYGVSESYHDARACFDNKSNTNSFQIYKTKPAGGICYSNETKLCLINSIKSGSLSGTRKIFEELFNENEQLGVDKKQLGVFLYEEIIHVIYEIKLNISDFEELIPLLLHDDLLKTTLEKLSEKLCSLAVSLNMANARSSDSRMIQYVNMNYCNADMSLKVLSDKVNMPIYMVSKAFKEHSGVNYIEYITALRMEKAKSLLTSIGYDVERISKMVGYENEYSFRRAFLKYEKIKPKEYVEKMGIKNNKSY